MDFDDLLDQITTRVPGCEVTFSRTPFSRRVVCDVTGLDDEAIAVGIDNGGNYGYALQEALEQILEPEDENDPIDG